jgi:Concanavalin A-like lectin/glucanases superfamily
MLGYTSLSKSALKLIFLGTVAACSPRTLTLVDLFTDGGLTPPSIDGNPQETSDGATIAGLSRGLVGLWHLDDVVGSTVASDSSGNGNDATLVGLDPALAWVPGRQGGALAPNGLGYASAADSASIDSITAQVTLAAWVYFDGVIPVDYGTAISRQIRTTNEQYYHLSLYQDGTPTLFIGFSASIAAARPTAPQPVVSRHWTHLAGTYDGALAIIYVDGVAAGSRSITGVFPRDTTPVILSGNGNAGAVTEFFPGRLDEIVLYNRALSPDEIKLLATPVAF